MVVRRTSMSTGVDDLSGVESKKTTTVALDFGRITIDDDPVLYLPHRRRERPSMSLVAPARCPNFLEGSKFHLGNAHVGAGRRGVGRPAPWWRQHR